MGDEAPRAIAQGERYLVTRELADKRHVFDRHVGKMMIVGDGFKRFHKVLVLGEPASGQPWELLNLQKCDVRFLRVVPSEMETPFGARETLAGNTARSPAAGTRASAAEGATSGQRGVTDGARESDDESAPDMESASDDSEDETEHPVGDGASGELTEVKVEDNTTDPPGTAVEGAAGGEDANDGDGGGQVEESAGVDSDGGATVGEDAPDDGAGAAELDEGSDGDDEGDGEDDGENDGDAAGAPSAADGGDEVADGAVELENDQGWELARGARRRLRPAFEGVVGQQRLRGQGSSGQGGATEESAVVTRDAGVGSRRAKPRERVEQSDVLARMEARQEEWAEMMREAMKQSRQAAATASSACEMVSQVVNGNALEEAINKSLRRMGVGPGMARAGAPALGELVGGDALEAAKEAEGARQQLGRVVGAAAAPSATEARRKAPSKRASKASAPSAAPSEAPPRSRKAPAQRRWGDEDGGGSDSSGFEAGFAGAPAAAMRRMRAGCEAEMEWSLDGVAPRGSALRALVGDALCVGKESEAMKVCSLLKRMGAKILRALRVDNMEIGFNKDDDLVEAAFELAGEVNELLGRCFAAAGIDYSDGVGVAKIKAAQHGFQGTQAIGAALAMVIGEMSDVVRGDAKARGTMVGGSGQATPPVTKHDGMENIDSLERMVADERAGKTSSGTMAFDARMEDRSSLEGRSTDKAAKGRTYAASVRAITQDDDLRATLSELYTASTRSGGDLSKARRLFSEAVSSKPAFMRTLMNEVEEAPKGAKQSERIVFSRIGEIKTVMLQALRAKLKTDLQYKAQVQELSRVVYYWDWDSFDVKTLLSADKCTTWFGKTYASQVEDWTSNIAAWGQAWAAATKAARWLHQWDDTAEDAHSSIGQKVAGAIRSGMGVEDAVRLIAQQCMALVVDELEKLLLTTSEPEFKTVLPPMWIVWKRFERSDEWIEMQSQITFASHEKSRAAEDRADRDRRARAAERRQGDGGSSGPGAASGGARAQRADGGSSSSGPASSGARTQRASDDANARPANLPFVSDQERDRWLASADSKTAGGRPKCWLFHMKGWCAHGGRGHTCQHGLH